MPETDRILILDGAMGTMLQQRGLSVGCNDYLNVTNPDAILQIHREYVEAGADIISTNTFNSNAISLADYGLADRAYEIARAGAEVAKRAGARYVAGSMGPTNRTLSMSPDVNAPAHREISYDQLLAAYLTQARGLIDGGADIILIETIFDTLNAKAAIDAVRQISPDIPIMLSGTVSDASGRLLSGQTVEAFYHSVKHAKPLSVGLNCGYGAKHLLPFLRRLEAVAEAKVSVHPNAGLPNIAGTYDETPETFSADMEQYFAQGLVDIAGGCCGTTPAHIAAMAKVASKYSVRAARQHKMATILCGLEPLEVSPESNFVNVGERTNVAGSAKFARLIREGNYEEALSIARAQADAGAQVIDVCMDDAMIDGPAAMTTFLNLMASDPEIARLPVMIDSSHWATLEAGLKCAQGKSIVNSISIKEGEEAFLARAKRIQAYGAAAVVMLFDEQGQADSYQRKIDVAKRAYELLRDAGFPVEDIIFDPNILAVATGMPEHDAYARDYIEATRWIKANLPGAKVSGGVSNLSFAFRGNNQVRKAMHAVFLYHAISAGMDMGIVNPQMVQLYDDIDPELLERVEDMILYRREDAADRLAAIAQQIADADKGEKPAAEKAPAAPSSVEERISQALLRGDVSTIAADAVEACQKAGNAIAVINDMLMPAMERVGALFADGKMFLPQVVKSARVMKQGVDALVPYMQAGDASETKYNGNIVVATVKGDVHDIGKNIVSVVMACNGYKIHDLGVMVPPEVIVAKAKELGADAIGVSGLITPSLHEMELVAREMQQQGLDIPLIIGGATTSAMHTAVKIAPQTQSPVVHSPDAAANVRILAQLMGKNGKEYIARVKASQNALRREWEASRQSPATMRAAELQGQAATDASPLPDEQVECFAPSISELIPLINWKAFYAAWGVPGSHDIENPTTEKARIAAMLHADAMAMLAAMEANGSLQIKGAKARMEDGKTIFVLTAGLGLDEISGKYRAQGDDYSAIMAKFLADRLAEACAEWEFPGEERRIAYGYPAAPDHSLKRPAFTMLDASRRLGVSLTSSNMIVPGESICGYYEP